MDISDKLGQHLNMDGAFIRELYRL